MSLGYASRLSHREDLGGRLGDPELFDPPHLLLDKASKLADLVQQANKIIAFTGAGISTAAGIPDFRGPQGVWTLQRKGLPLPKLQTSFVYAKPSLTHQALLGLLQSGKLQYICSQNVDSLHLRSGVPRYQLAELHGNCFAEHCQKCKREYVRDFEMDTVGFKPTGRCCDKPGCPGRLADHILDWEDALPAAELKATQQHASSADLALCLGTSLQIIPAANLPLRTVKAGGKLAIINLQGTPKDNKAEVVLHAKVDEVMSFVMHQVGLPIPPYVRKDSVMLSHTYEGKAAAALNGSSSCSSAATGTAATASEAAAPCILDDSLEIGAEAASESATATTGCAGRWGFTFSMQSIHGATCPLPMVASASVAFVPAAAAAAQDDSGAAPGSAAAALEPAELSGQLPWKVTRSCPGSWQQVAVTVDLQLVAAADTDKQHQQLHYTIPRPPPPPPHMEQQQQQPGRNRTTRGSTKASQQPVVHIQTVSFTTQVLDYTEKQQQLIQQLQGAAAASRSAAVEPVAAPAAATAAGAGSSSSKAKQHSKKGSKHTGTSSAADDAGGASSKSRSTNLLQQQEQLQQFEEVKLEAHQHALPEQPPAPGEAAADSAVKQLNGSLLVNGASNDNSEGHLKDVEMADCDGLSSEASSEQAGDDDSDYPGSDSCEDEEGAAEGVKRQHSRRSSDRPSKRARRTDV